MQSVVIVIFEALAAILTWPAVFFLLAGVFAGMLFGVLPGLGGPILLALMIPFTYGMDTRFAMILFGGAVAGGTFAGSISAILLNIPGGAPNAATLFDGYPMSQEGRATEALGVSAMASAMGAVFGIVILILAIPVARRVILAFGPAEFFWLAILGLTVIAVASMDSILKGLISGGVGLMISFIGFLPLTGEIRYTFGTRYLWDGVELIVALIGLFAIAEVINLTRKGGTISETGTVSNRRDVFKGMKFVLSRPFLFLKSAVIGTLVGIVPGVGGVVPPFISYSQAMQSSDDPDSFGKGNPEGVLAPEAANDAKDGGALLPTIVFGIPGSAVMVVLLGALQIHGLDPGQELLNEEIGLLFLLVMSLLVGNILTSAVGIVFVKQFTSITTVPANLIIPPILVISIVGTFALRNQILDVAVAIGFGILGYTMLRFGYSRVALVIAIVLGPLAETSFHQAFVIAGGDPTVFITRPISFVLFVMTVITLLLPVRQTLRNRASSEGES